jgi:tRNA nucleotidyltransferase (CCA-adding enzyme)
LWSPNERSEILLEKSGQAQDLPLQFLLDMSPLPEKIITLAKTIKTAGGRALLVGGCVRDELMGIEPKDWDLEVYGIEPENLRGILETFGQVNIVGEAFTVYKVDSDIDVAIPRLERKVSRGHKGFIMEGDPAMSFEEACKRRDFTVNAILKDPLTAEIIDPYDGRADIEQKLLRVVSRETFAEDSLRVLRAAQFAARFEFDIESDTSEICRGIDLTDLPAERIWGETEKLLLRAQKPSIGLRWFYDLGVADQLFPELKSLVGVKQEPEWHPEGDVDIHTLLTVDYARTLIDDLPYAKQVAVMLGALCHDFGKPPTTEFFDGRWRSHAHDVAGIEPTISFLDRLNIQTLNGYDVRDQIVELVRYHLKPGEFYKQRENVGDGAFRRLARKVEPDLLYRVSLADNMGRNGDWLPREKWFTPVSQEWFLAKVRELDVEHEAPKPILMGRHLIELGLDPSPKFKEIIDAVYEMQLDGKVTSVEDAIAEAYKLLDGISS